MREEGNEQGNKIARHAVPLSTPQSSSFSSRSSPITRGVMLTPAASALNITNMYKSSLGYMKVSRRVLLLLAHEAMLIPAARLWSRLCRLLVSST